MTFLETLSEQLYNTEPVDDVHTAKMPNGNQYRTYKIRTDLSDVEVTEYHDPKLVRMVLIECKK